MSLGSVDGAEVTDPAWGVVALFAVAGEGGGHQVPEAHAEPPPAQ